MDDDEAESKKPRLEENKFDDKTSTYDFSDEEDMGEDEPFTLVTYKKKRAEGIPVVFRPTGEVIQWRNILVQHFGAIIVSDLDTWRKVAAAHVGARSAQKTMTTRSANQFFSLSARTVRAITLPPTQAARRTRLLHKCDDMNLSTEDNRAATKPLQILRFGHRNHHIKETLQENHKEYNRKTKQGCEHPRDIRQKVMDPRALMFAQAIRVKLHVVLSDPQEKYQPIPTTPVA
ncbi:hypothetical protein HPB52_021554 [Rhipicephalus sanguineus]|uniref:Uncharacterized protein n=1 Tax=Rhipicephalus sanguineus TaxID=34632 RepID=A0A9D4SNA4_RHISA|nr:hypothetical protein HPB52_021554 [Rhipicephalus sanguineus]